MAVRAEAPGKWSIRDVVQHLADRNWSAASACGWCSRTTPEADGLQPGLWADRLEYGSVDIGEALEQFTVLRRANARLWARLTPVDLERIGIHANEAR